MNIQQFTSQMERINAIQAKLFTDYAMDLQNRINAACKANKFVFICGMGVWSFQPASKVKWSTYYDHDSRNDAPNWLQPIIDEMNQADELVEYFCSNYLEGYSGK